MDWVASLIIIVGLLFVMMAMRLPIAFAFLFINIIFAIYLWNGGAGLGQLVISMYNSIGSFIMSPLPVFILLGEILFLTGIAPNALDTVDKLMGRIPGRLAMVSVASGTLFSALTGSSVSSVCLLGSMLTPEMERHGYKKTMSLGPIMASGGLASIIPPSGMAVLIGALANVSIGALLIGGIVPGLIMAGGYVTYIVLRCIFQPDVAPNYVVQSTTLSQKLISAVRYVLPLGIVIFSIMGFIYMGIATPTEAASTGAIAAFILAIAYRKLNWNVLKGAMMGTLRVSAMVLMIIGGALAFSQILAYSGATQGLIRVVSSLDLPPLALVGTMMVITLILGAFMDSMAIVMICIPIFMPIVEAMGFPPILFCLLLLINIETGLLTPPFGLILFAMKGVAPPDTTTGDVYKAVVPFVLLNILVIVLLMLIPQLGMWLPSSIKM